MGMFSFAITANYTRYYKDLKEISKHNKIPAFIMFIDTAISVLLFGSGLQDYLNYKFYEKSFKERKTYVTIGYMNKTYQTLANVKYADFFSNKINFHRNFSKYAQREYFSPDDTYENFQEFISRHQEFVMKPLQGLGGGGVEKVITSKIENKQKFFENLKESRYFIEELIVQDENWGILSPDSINTIRVMTTQCNGKSNIIFGVARIGSGKSIVDNFHQGGQAILVDLETGKLIGNGIDKKLNESEYSITGIRFDGFQIPYWKEIKEMVLEAALVNDSVNIIGWDVAIGKYGPVIVESNRGPGFDLVQVVLKKGTKYILDNLLEEVVKEEKGISKKTKDKDVVKL